MLCRNCGPSSTTPGWNVTASPSVQECALLSGVSLWPSSAWGAWWAPSVWASWQTALAGKLVLFLHAGAAKHLLQFISAIVALELIHGFVHVEKMQLKDFSVLTMTAAMLCKRPLKVTKRISNILHCNLKNCTI